ncbi:MULTISPECIES: DUF86 domain-containing protein [unclassified Thioalkalivibrio]|uniref:type VII toxin-antitoxin system HepT family RNase toxin n=1 Tax=unclassified Thioalkalivibrio TaxID=2621013 RepID=UPI00037F814E|nr:MULTISPECIES: DUF86 domain-containing protein [unclassified Thioalkalivibrio]
MDRALVEKKLAFIRTCVRELEELADPTRLDTDVRERRFVEHTLQLAIQAALDVASHWVSARRLGEPESNRDLFLRLQGEGMVSAKLAETLAAMAGFRNILVHGYQNVDPARVREILEHHLPDLQEFVDAVFAALEEPPR